MTMETCEESLRVNVVGLGHVGGEVCLAAAAAGHVVTGIDTNLEQLRDLRESRDRDEWSTLRAAVRAGRIQLRERAGDADPARVWVVAVPTPLDADGRPDTSNVAAAGEAVARALTPNTLVVLESTSYPGTTEEVFLPPFVAAGWTPGVDVLIGFSPERIDPGSRHWRMRDIPKLVAGYSDACLKAVTEFYRTLVQQVHPMSSIRAAEMAKLYENSWRLVNIAFASEIEELCLAVSLDPWEIAQACRTKPFGFVGFEPGPGAGGHCIPVDSRYLSEFAHWRGQDPRILDTALAANFHRPAVIVGRILDAIAGRLERGGQARVLLVGVTYKANIADTRESAAMRILDILLDRGVHVDFHDPHVPWVRSSGGAVLTAVPLTKETVRSYDCIAVLVAHDAIEKALLRDADCSVVDTRNALGS
jgi:UDP-N-acetyl-D-glucosamine dehydrogenase